MTLGERQLQIKFFFIAMLCLCVCDQRGLEQEQMEIEGETVEVFGVERIVHSVDESPTTWQCYFLADG